MDLLYSEDDYKPLLAPKDVVVHSQSAPAYKSEPTKAVYKLRSSEYRVRYEFRWLSSKAAFLVLLWSVLLSFSSGTLSNIYPLLAQGETDNELYSNLVILVPYLSWAVVAPVAGWLADSWFGTYRVAKFGVLLLFLSTIGGCVIFQVTGFLLELDSPLFVCVLIVSNTVGFAGQGILLVTVLTFGLNQMPDASTGNITSYIAWFVCSIQAGFWLCDATSFTAMACLTQYLDYARIWSLLPVLFVSLVLISDFFLAPKWLIIEPTSPQSLKIIYQVLKFAAKHKAPVNRSALTYWEDDIPSRLDLGKSRYGGPFSTEQVEDVKVILRLLAISAPVFLVMLAFYLAQESPLIPGDDTSCEINLIQDIIGNDSFSLVLGTVLYEIAIYPFVSHLLPSMFKRFGIASVLVALLNAAYLGLSVAQSLQPELSWVWLTYPNAVITGCLKIVWMTSALELIYAQSPYKMRGLMVGYFWCLNLISYVLVGASNTFTKTVCDGKYCLVVHSSISAVISIVGSALFCALARWYKRRVRDDIATPHRWVEDAYDKYLVT